MSSNSLHVHIAYLTWNSLFYDHLVFFSSKSSRDLRFYKRSHRPSLVYPTRATNWPSGTSFAKFLYSVEIKCQLDATDDFYCRSYCLLNMFRAPLCPSSGAREYYTSGCASSATARRPDTQPSAPHHTDNLKTKAPNTTGSDHLYNTLELLMMGIVLPETCWACNKICNKYHVLHLVGILFPDNKIIIYQLPCLSMLYRVTVEFSYNVMQ